MRMDRFYLTVVREATVSPIRKIRRERPGYARRSALIRGRFQIALAIMPRFEIYGRAKPSRTYRRLFMVLRGITYCNRSLARSLSPSPSLTFLALLFIGRTRERALLTHSSKTTTRGTGLHGNAAADKHQIQSRALAELQLSRLFNYFHKKLQLS